MKLLLAILLLGFSLSTSADVMPEITKLQTAWAKIKYKMPEDQRIQAFEQLEAQAEKLAKNYPDKAEPLIWEAIILATHAGEKGGLGALSLVKKAKNLLLDAEKINPEALDGSVYTSLGSLYYQVPGWPFGFGDDDKARDYLSRALKLNPDSIDANYFYGDFLIDQGDYQNAVKVLEKALRVPDRKGRPIADAGRRAEIRKALEQARRFL